jgi:hypothetical protein
VSVLRAVKTELLEEKPKQIGYLGARRSAL